MTDAKQSSEDDASTDAGTPTESPTPSPPSSGDHDTSRTVRWLRSKAARRLLIIAAILAIGVVAFLWGRKLYPTEQAITSPPSYSISIRGGGTQGAVPGEFLSFKRQPDGTIEIQSTDDTSQTSTSDQSFGFITSLTLSGPNVKIIQCPEPRSGCDSTNSPSGEVTVIQFSIGSSSPPTETAVIQDPSFGFAENNETALAEMPYISLISLPSASGPNKLTISLNSNPFSLSIGYYIPDAKAYDWSMPPLKYNPEVTWEETINPISVGGQEAQGAAQAIELTGSNRAAQSTDNKNILISGVLFGVAGAAALAAVVAFLQLIFKVE
jgi:hypothetical protein